MSHCHAKTRSGGQCRRLAMGNGRCYMHGGKSPGPPQGNKNALKHGLCAKGFLIGEEKIWDDLPLGSLDDEIKVARIMLRRAFVADNPEQVTLFLRRVERLEATRAAINEKGQGSHDPRATARQICETIREIEEVTAGTPPVG